MSEKVGVRHLSNTNYIANLLSPLLTSPLVNDPQPYFALRIAQFVATAVRRLGFIQSPGPQIRRTEVNVTV